MKSRIVWGVLITAVAALLVAGAVNRTIARSETGTAAGEQTAQQQRRGQAAVNTTEGTSEYALDGSESAGAGNGGQGQGAGRQGQVGGELGSGAGQGAGRGTGGQGQGGGRGAGGGQSAGSAAEAAEPLANLDDLETIQGTVVDANEELLLLAQADGEPLEISGRAWRFALENGFTVGQEDTITVVGFYDEDHFEPIAVTNDATGQQIQLREASGRPLWAGRGQRNAGT